MDGGAAAAAAEDTATDAAQAGAVAAATGLADLLDTGNIAQELPARRLSARPQQDRADLHGIVQRRVPAHHHTAG